MPVQFGTVAAPSVTSANDSSNQPALQGKQGDMIVSELHGKFYTQAYRGNLFYAANAPAGGSLVVYSATAYTGLGLWNPAGSGKNLVLVRATAVPTTAAGTGTTVGYMWTQNAGSALGTAAPLSATTPITATRGQTLLNAPAGQGSSAAIAVSAATLTSAGTLFIPSGVAAGTGAITVPNTFLGLTEYFDGTLIIQPGVFFGIGLAVASTGTWNCSFVWEETPL